MRWMPEAHNLGASVPTSLSSLQLRKRRLNIPAPSSTSTAMHDERSHPVLQQTALSVNPFVDLPKAPTLPHNYASLPSTLPPSILNSPPAASNPELPAYVTSSSGFAAHPRTIIAQNKALLDQLEKQHRGAEMKVQEWEQSIKDRDLAEKRRKAPGWLDSDERILQPERPKAEMSQASLIDQQSPGRGTEHKYEPDVDDLGAAMDRAFGRNSKT